MRKSSLDAFFKPESVAVIGASEKDKTIGQALVHNLLRDGFPGKIYPVNRKYQEIQGLPAYPLVTEVKEPIDLAIIAIPIRDVPSAMRECGQAGHRRRHHHFRRRQGSGVAGQGDRSRHQGRGAKRGDPLPGAQLPGYPLPIVQVTRQLCAPLRPTGQPGLHLPERRPVQLHPGVGHPQEDRLQPLHQRGVHGRRGFRRPDRLPGQRREGQEHRHLHGEPDPAPQVYERGPLRVPGQTHHHY